MSKSWYGHHIETIKGDDYVLFKDYLELDKMIKIMEKYLELIYDIGYDCDGLTKTEDLFKLVDELVRYASLGRACNTTECIYVNRDKKYNILGEEINDRE